MPTDAGHRYFVDRLLADRQVVVGGAPALELSLIRRELDEAVRVTTETLSEVTNLLAIVSAPSVETATIRHIEVLALQPRVVMVVIISSAGGVSKYASNFETPVDPGPDRLGRRVPQRAPRRPRCSAPAWCNQRLADPTLGTRERTFIDRLAPAFRRLAGAAEDTLTSRARPACSAPTA